MILEGKCSIHVEGVGLVKLCTANSEDCFFGELALLYDAPRAATVKVASEEAKLGLLDRASFKYIMQVFVTPNHHHPMISTPVKGVTVFTV